MSGGDWGLVGLGGSKHGPQSLTFFFFFFFFLNWWNVTGLISLPAMTRRDARLQQRDGLIGFNF